MIHKYVHTARLFSYKGVGKDKESKCTYLLKIVFSQYLLFSIDTIHFIQIEDIITIPLVTTICFFLKIVTWY